MIEDTITLIFWNIGGHNRQYTDTSSIAVRNRAIANRGKIARHIALLTRTHNPDTVLLAESDFWENEAAVLEEVNGFTSFPVSPPPFFHISANQLERRVQILSRHGRGRWSLVLERKYYAIWRLLSPKNASVLIVTVHFPPIYQDGDDGQRDIAVRLKRDMEYAEGLYCRQNPTERGFKGANLIVLGDFNASPFDQGIVSSYGLNATPVYDLADKEGRREMEAGSVPYLFNPMWRFLGGTEGQSGTFYYGKAEESKPVWLGWYILDQALLRPSLRLTKIEILTSNGAGDSNLLTKPRTKPFSVPKDSDHLPILVQFQVSK